MWIWIVFQILLKITLLWEALKKKGFTLRHSLFFKIKMMILPYRWFLVVSVSGGGGDLERLDLVCTRGFQPSLRMTSDELIQKKGKRPSWQTSQRCTSFVPFFLFICQSVVTHSFFALLPLKIWGSSLHVRSADCLASERADSRRATSLSPLSLFSSKHFINRSPAATRLISSQRWSGCGLMKINEAVLNTPRVVRRRDEASVPTF